MTTEIKCPKCGEVFTVDEAGYAAIVKQVRDREFDKELSERVKQFAGEKEMLRRQLEAEAGQRAADAAAAREKEKAETAAAWERALAEKEQALLTLEAKLAQVESGRRLAVTEAVGEKERETARLLTDQQKEAAQQLADQQKEAAKLLAERERELSEQSAALTKLQSRLDAFEIEKKLALTEAQAEADRALEASRNETAAARNQLLLESKQAAIEAEQLRQTYEARLAEKDEVIAHYKDFKARLSTKLVGESLEQHCLTEFNKVRAMAFRNATFGKDNDATGGSKGDFIFRESADGIEFISIMFEMKNESDTPGPKHKNEDFFKELDKDRREKKCEYAVLVSMLEPDNEFYNQGIADVTYCYEKMYVIRPQFFIPFISLLREAALHSLTYRQRLAEVQAQNIDITGFEDAVADFKDKFGASFTKAGNSFNKAIEEIDKAIKQMEAVKEDLRRTVKHLSEANNKVDGLTIKRLTRGNPTMQQKFAELHEGDGES